MVEVKDEVQINPEVSEDEITDKEESEIDRLKKELFEEKMAREADKSRFTNAIRLMEENYSERFKHAKEIYDRRLKEEEERLLINFVVSGILPMFDTMNQTVKHFEYKNPEITETIKIALRRIGMILSGKGFHEAVINIGDDYDTNLHNPLQIVTGEKADLIHEVFHNAWAFKKDKQEKIIRLADVIITKIEE